jgi:hypothetical protein
MTNDIVHGDEHMMGHTSEGRLDGSSKLFTSSGKNQREDILQWQDQRIHRTRSITFYRSNPLSTTSKIIGDHEPVVFGEVGFWSNVDIVDAESPP